MEKYFLLFILLFNYNTYSGNNISKSKDEYIVTFSNEYLEKGDSEENLIKLQKLLQILNSKNINHEEKSLMLNYVNFSQTNYKIMKLSEFKKSKI